MRQLILDTETTGLDPRRGDKIIEFAALEMIDRELTGKSLHLYINPECEISAEATRIHGITNEHVKDKPAFKNVVAEIVHFIEGSELIIHNAKFDLGFLDYQFKIEKYKLTKDYVKNVIDTLSIARAKYPGSKNTLDALCDRFKIDRTIRGYHGALIDCKLLSDVYLNLTREQISLIDADQKILDYNDFNFEQVNIDTKDLKVVNATKDELESHNKILDRVQHTSNGKCIWLKK